MDVVGMGTPYYDTVVNVKKIPELDGAAAADAVFRQGGGKVATAMVAAARLGKKAGMIARVGDSHSGEFIINDFKINGVDTSAIVVDKKGTTSSFCLSLSEQASQKRIFIGRPGTARSLQPEDINYDYIHSAKYFEVESGEENISGKALAFAKESGVKTVIDADGYKDELKQVIPYIDYFIASEFCYKAMMGQTGYEEGLRKIRAMGPPVVIVTLGSEGYAGIDEEGNYFKKNSFKIKAVDTTGAGDVFHGAFIVGLLDNMTVQESAGFASAVSAIKCMFPGGRTGIPTRDMVESFLKTGEFDRTELENRMKTYSDNI